MVGGVIGSPKALGDDAEVSSVSPPADISAGECPDSDWLDDHGDKTAEARWDPEWDDVCDMFRVE